LPEHEGKAALAACGVRAPASRLVAPDAVLDAARTLGYPVAIKATGATLEHKTELGGVALNVRTPAEAAAAAERLSRLSRLLLVEKMVDDGVAEILIGITADPQFGLLLLLGAGGVLAELLADTVVLLPPFTADAIESALGKLRAAKLLRGYRGRPPGDVPALLQTALACARYAQQNLDRLLELDLNPVIVRPAGLGAVAVDALVRLSEES
jgi:acetyl-CoA synthetase